MKTLSVRIVLLLIPLLALATGCGDPPTSSNENRLSGTLHGKVELYDMRGNPLADHSGVKVTAEGTSYQAVTGADGIWQIKDLPAGTYNLRFSKDGFNDHRIISYGFVGGGDDYLRELPSMVATPTGFEFTGFTVDISNEFLQFSGSISNPDLKDLPVVIYLGRTPEVSSTSNDHFYFFKAQVFHYPATDPIRDTHFDLSFESLRRQFSLPPGSTIYARAYIGTPRYTAYYDPSRYIAVRTDLSKGSDVISFTIP